MCMISSCTYFIHQHSPCRFDPETLSVVGDDNDAPNIQSNTYNASRTIMNLNGYTFADSYRISSRNDHFQVRYSIKQCKDTTWAKKKILEEVTRIFPFEIIDTFEGHKVYSMRFLDTSVLHPRNYDDPVFWKFELYPSYLIQYNRTYPDILSIPLIKANENKGINVEIGNVYPPELIWNRYNIGLPRKYTDYPVNITNYLEYLKEEFCIEINLEEDYTIPVKLIRLK